MQRHVTAAADAAAVTEIVVVPWMTVCVSYREGERTRVRGRLEHKSKAMQAACHLPISVRRLSNNGRRASFNAVICAPPHTCQ